MLAPLRALLLTRLALVDTLGAAVLVHAASRGERREEPSIERGTRRERMGRRSVARSDRVPFAERASVARRRVARGAREARATARRACGEPAGEARERTRENICRGQPRRHGRWGGTHRKPGEVVICLVQKNADSDTAPPMAAQMGYTCARRDGRGTVSAGERGRGARLA